MNDTMTDGDDDDNDLAIQQSSAFQQPLALSVHTVAKVVG